VTGAEVGVVTKAALPLVKPVGGWVRRRVRPDTSRPALTRLADLLADRVARDETVLLDQLRGGPDSVMDLDFQAAPRFRSAEGGGSGVLSSIGPYFRRQVPPRRLVVLGKAGAGKTVLAIHLLLDQLRDRVAMAENQRIDTPVPVRVNVSGWDGGGDFTEWLASRLASDYGLHPQVARALLDTARILPVLDGLDEMDPPDGKPERARVALDRLNETPWRNRTVVVTCRTGVYTRIRELRGDAGLHGATTIALQPLSAIDIYDYLHHYRDQLGIPDDAWAPVIDQIGQNPEGPLATALRTPWLLGLAVTALGRDRRTVAQLAACRDTTEIRDLLFAALIPAAIHGTRRTGPTRDYTEQKVQTWMHTLAQHLERRRAEGTGGTEISLGEVWALAGTRRCRALHTLAVGLVPGLAVGLAGWPVGHPMFGLIFGLGAGFVVGLVALRAPNVTAPKRFAWRVPGRSRWRKGLKVGLVVGLVVGLMVELPHDVPGPGGAPHMEFHLDVLRRLITGTAVGLMVGFITGLRTNAVDRFALGQDARRVIHDDFVAALTAGLTVGLPVGLWIGLQEGLRIGLSFGLSFGLLYGLLYGLQFGLLYGLPVGLAFGLTAGRHATASLLFAFTEIFPARPAQFLEWARNAGLLRVTGIAYQCRHESYQQWLADDHRSS
jgi:NACHT domain